MTPNAYERAADVLLAESGCTVRKWRSGTSGTAYTSDDDWGIEVPLPRGPVSFGVFAHEVAHQMLHRHNSLPRWREEVEAEDWALAQFDRFELNGREKYERKAALHLAYAFAKATRRSERLRDVIPTTYPEWWARVDHARAWAMLHPGMSQARAALDAEASS